MCTGDSNVVTDYNWLLGIMGILIADHLHSNTLICAHWHDILRPGQVP